MKKLVIASILAICLILASVPSFASVIDPNVIRGRASVSAGISIIQGFGLVLTGNMPVDNRMSLGGSFGFSLEESNPYLMDIHMNLQFMEPTARNPVSMSLVGGVWGGTSDGIWLSKKETEGYIQPEIGIAMSYMFNSVLTGRANIVYGPSLGIELGYKITPALEGIFALSEQVVGIKFKVF